MTVVTTVSSDVVAGPPIIVTVTSTSESLLEPFTPSPTSSSDEESTSTSTSATLLPSPTGSTSTGGRSTNGRTIAVAVVVPLFAVALIVAGLVFFFKKRKAKRSAKEMRREEMEEYVYNPNQDPNLPPAAAAAAGVGSGGAGSADDDDGDLYDEGQADPAGYRGWGATPAAASRKMSGTMSNGTGPIGVALSEDDGGGGGGAPAPAPIGVASSTTGPSLSPTFPSRSDTVSGDPLLRRGQTPQELPDSEVVSELGGAPVAGGGARRDIHRGPSNASSSYSVANRSDASGEGSIPGHAGYPAHHYGQHEGPYDDMSRPPVPYDGPYGPGQPVIRDVQARRNTRIENPSVYPAPGNAGIAQNF